MKLFSACSGECCLCACGGGGCLAGIGDDDFSPASKEQIVERLDKGEYKEYTHVMKDYLKRRFGYAYIERPWDYEGYALRYNVELPNGKIVIKDAFRFCNRHTVPLVYNYYKDGGGHLIDTSIDNVLGVACLEHREDGVYARCRIYDTPFGLKLKNLGLYKCIKGLTVYATECKVVDEKVISGVIQVVKIISN